MSSFARTKIQPPRPRALIERPVLEAQLGNALLSHRLVLITAAAGFGKTSALARQIERLPPGTAVAWVSCDEGDLPLQLFACLVAALDPFDLPWRTAPDALIARAAAAPDTPEGRAGPPVRAVVTELINALDACDAPRGVIMVDDLHRITHPGVFEFLDRLLERLTPHWTMAIASRDTPPIALARLRAAGELAEFTLEALRFDEDESIRVAHAAGLPADAAQALHARTAGWPAGLRLGLSVLASMPGASLEGSAPVIDRRVFEFLAAEVLDRLDAELREFLLRTSVLPELTASRSAALTGDARAAERLEAIERAGLFVSVLAEAEPTLRLHDLFRDALENRLQRERPALWRELLQRAATTEPDPLRRVSALMRAEAWREAEAALVDVGESLIVDGDTAVVESLLARFPTAQRTASGGLLFLAAKLAWARWDWATMLARASAAAEAFASDGDGSGQARALSYRALALASVGPIDEARRLATELLAPPELQDIVAARALMALCWIEFSHGNQLAIAPLWRRLTHHLERTSDVVGWYECTPIPSYANLAGMRAPLLRHVQAARRRWPDRPSPARGMCTVIEGLLHLWAGDIAAAEACAALAAEDARWLARPPNLEAFITLLPALLDGVQGRSSEAQARLQRLIDEVMQSGNAVRIGLYRGVYLYAALRCAAAADDTPAVARRAAELQAAVSAAPPDALPAGLARQYATAARAYAALAAGDDDRACREWQDIIEREHECDHYAQVPEARVRLADASLRAGRPLAEAAATLRPLLERIAASGEFGLLRMAGAATLARLVVVNWRGLLPADALPALRRWAATEAAPSQAAAAAPLPAVAGGLSSREADVLARIAAGDSNKLIAREFDLSPHTVKRHVANILDKLALRSRGQAAAWYHEHHG